VTCKVVTADLLLREGDTSTAKDLCQQCIRSTWEIDNEEVSYSLEKMADVTRWGVTVTPLTSSWAVVYVAHSHKYQQNLGLHKALLFLGDVFLSNRDEDTAQTLFTVALEGFTAMDVHRSRAQCMTRLGDLAQKRGEVSNAVELWKVARSLFQQSVQMGDVVKIDSRLAAAEEEHKKTMAKVMDLNVPSTTLGGVTAEKIEPESVEEDSVAE
jgi:hypothetical protein